VCISILVSVGVIAGLFLLFGIRFRQFSNDITQLARHPPTMKQIVEEANGIPSNFIKRRFEQLRDMLSESGREAAYGKYCRVSACLAAVCGMLAIFMGNPFLAPVLALIGLFSPLLYLQVSAMGHTKQQNAEMQTAMSIVTSSYMRTKIFLQSVAENIDYIHEPVKAVLKQFLAQNQFITTNVEKSLMDLKTRINNDVWKEWCEALILCQHDRTKMDMLDPIINKLRNMDAVQTDLDTMLYKPVKDFTLMMVLAISFFPILFFLNRAWFDILVNTIPGKIAVTFTFAALLYGLFACMKAVKPLEYRR
jgi:hypothetical protein